MKDLRRYLVFKYIQYLVLPSPNTIITLLGLLASLYVMLILTFPSVSRKSTVVFISNIAQADILAGCSIFSAITAGMIKSETSSASFQSGLRQNFQIANVHASSLLLSCVSLEAFLITFLPVETRHIRNVRCARVASKIIWAAVITECFLYQLECIKCLNVSHRQVQLLMNFCHDTTAWLKLLIYPIGILLRIFNIYLFYKMYF
ncbi:P2Y purinoceptor 6-like [Cricetulus griseus]|uniref:P2Y purinoceptor 6-like n=1 Tax=Cricetulus griseus TaxID=10029 RepID=A0A8C2LMP6_CRIGR|nr:P2Y purinoceptor 6-like [Cricetulus griseus]XP_027288634.1 P2Y purinoceptor 6-like [Cricetulus griseus]